MDKEEISQEQQRRLPRGIIIIASLLFIGAFFSCGIMLAPTTTLQEFNLPRSLLLVGALATGVLGYGLLRLRRWAWGAALGFVFVNAYFLILGALAGGGVQVVGLSILALTALYLFLPHVRAAFLRPPDTASSIPEQHND